MFATDGPRALADDPANVIDMAIASKPDGAEAGASRLASRVVARDILREIRSEALVSAAGLQEDG